MKVLLQILLLSASIPCIFCAPKPVDEEKLSYPWEHKEAKWPSPAEVAEWGKAELKGNVMFPGSLGYMLGSWMTNTRFNSKFGVVVMVETEDDVQKCLLFCIKHGIRPTVKSGGHDYVGRSAGDYTFSINTGRMKGITLNEMDNASPTGASVVVQPGNQWSAVYEKLEEAGYIVVGGGAHTVHPGGYTTGGGHSPLSRTYGLSVDNTLGFTLVTPTGDIIKMTGTGGSIRKVGETEWKSFNDPDLFWAVRGGGGGTFGVVTSFTYQMYKAPTDGICQYFAFYPILHPLFGRVGDKVIEKFSSILLNNMTKDWNGYVIHNGAGYAANKVNAVQLKGQLMFSFIRVGGCEGGQAGVDLFSDIYPEYMFIRTVIDHPTFWAYTKNYTDPIGYKSYIINRLIQPKDLEPNSDLPNVIADIVDAKKQLGCTWTLLGGQVSTPSVESSVSQDFRTSYGSFSCGVGWTLDEEEKESIEAMKEYGVKMYTIGKGVYYNEPDYDVDNWKEEFWGSMERYNKLLEIKKKYDPKHIFTCHKCIGSDIDY